MVPLLNSALMKAYEFDRRRHTRQHTPSSPADPSREPGWLRSRLLGTTDDSGAVRRS
jgi:hypothetical protein